MTVKTLADTNGEARLSDRAIYLVGPSQLQNSLLASYLNQVTGAKCIVAESLGKIPGRCDGDTEEESLVLWDCRGKDPENCLLEYDIEGDEGLRHRLLAFFNVGQGLGIEQNAISYGVKGFFYEQSSPEELEKGVRAIFAGELWISRHILAEYMRKSNSSNQLPNTRKRDTPLTPRETEILLMVASGAKNAEIADKLFISPHTVRTHLFNIYKKIRVPNRFQAMLWAAENL